MGAQRDRSVSGRAGSWRAIARIDMVARGYPLHVLHEYRMTPTSSARKRSSTSSPATMKTAQNRGRIGQADGVGALRPPEVSYRGLVKDVQTQDIAISSTASARGCCTSRCRSAYVTVIAGIEACAFGRKPKTARSPGFGKRCSTLSCRSNKSAFAAAQRCWVQGRLSAAHVSWRAHPRTYRAEVCLTNATRANLGGLKHA